MIKTGQLIQGTVLRVMPYGAMVRLENGTVGLVHISEIADAFVHDLNQHCSQGASVTVRVLRQRDDGRWEFSIRQASKEQPAEADNFRAEQPMTGAAQKAAKREEFDEKMRDFLNDSSECIEDVRRHHDKRRNSKGKRR